MFDTRDKLVREAIYSTLLAKGYRIEGVREYSRLNQFKRNYGVDFEKIWSFLWVEPGNWAMWAKSDNFLIGPDGKRKENLPLAAPAEILNFPEVKPDVEIEIKVSEDYTAILTKEHISVGCQIVTWDTIDKINEARKQIFK
jgi:hypothetical protein